MADSYRMVQLETKLSNATETQPWVGQSLGKCLSRFFCVVCSPERLKEILYKWNNQFNLLNRKPEAKRDSYAALLSGSLLGTSVTFHTTAIPMPSPCSLAVSTCTLAATLHWWQGPRSHSRQPRHQLPIQGRPPLPSGSPLSQEAQDKCRKTKDAVPSGQSNMYPLV